MISFSISATLLGSPGFAIKNNIIRWSVQKSSTLRITGKTTLAGFGCDITGYYQADTIIYIENDDRNRIVPLKGSLNIGIHSFDCHNKILTNDLRKTLKATEYPTFIVRFVALERMPVLELNKDVVKGWIDIELAGVCKRFEIFYEIQKAELGIQLNGNRSFCFSDFKLVPPKKLGGIIKVKDDFQVDFKLALNQIK